MKVYVITKGDYSDYHICAVTLDEQNAEQLAKIYTDTWNEASVEEWDTEEKQNLLNGRVPYEVFFWKGVQFGKRVTVNMFTDHIDDFKPGVLLYDNYEKVKLFATDSSAAIKIAAEKRAQALAEREGIT